MHPIARRFSPKARAKVREIFGVSHLLVLGPPRSVGVYYSVPVPDPRKTTSMLCCALGVALSADDKVGRLACGLTRLFPCVDEVANQLIPIERGRERSLEWGKVADEAGDFMNNWSTDQASILQAFSEDGSDAPNS